MLYPSPRLSKTIPPKFVIRELPNSQFFPPCLPSQRPSHAKDLRENDKKPPFRYPSRVQRGSSKREASEGTVITHEEVAGGEETSESGEVSECMAMGANWGGHFGGWYESAITMASEYDAGCHFRGGASGSGG
ncbi:hypothetical protein KC19_3G196600 [Ceratodon purpureus]|uniref:Uncharacterized protein n=1 Tax=Ceratodon purpureus TaxID=3225 RepID=A0A8T0IP87_CERPU|nr:hypothetical protein KC19_3G196600 [Ceratodon purpureus]